MAHREMILRQTLPAVSFVSFGYDQCRPLHHYGPAIRTHWLLHYVESGFGKFIVGGQEYSVRPGHLFVIPPYTEVYYRADGQQPWAYIWVGFTAEGPLPEVFSQPVIPCPEAGQLFRKMKECGSLHNGRSWFLCACLTEAISLMVEQEPPRGDYAAQAVSYIQAEYAQHINVADIAKQLGLNRSYFSMYFKEKTGVSPGAFLERVRLEKAAELLRTTDCTVSMAAFSCGYEDQSHFTKRFKAHFGVLPKEVQEQMQETEGKDGIFQLE